MSSHGYEKECAMVSQRMRFWIANNPELYREVVLRLQNKKYASPRPLTVAAVVDDKLMSTYPVTKGHYNLANSYMTRYITHNMPKELEDAVFYAKKSDYLDGLDYSPVTTTDVCEQLKIAQVIEDDEQTDERKPGWLKRFCQWVW